MAGKPGALAVGCNGWRGHGHWPTVARTGSCPAAKPALTDDRRGGVGSPRTPGWPVPSAATNHKCACSPTKAAAEQVLRPDPDQLSRQKYSRGQLGQILLDLAREVPRPRRVVARPGDHLHPRALLDDRLLTRGAQDCRTPGNGDQLAGRAHPPYLHPGAATLECCSESARMINLASEEDVNSRERDHRRQTSFPYESAIRVPPR
jgi:hypothetical protein